MKRLRPWIFWLGFVVAASIAFNWYGSRGGVWNAWTYPTQEKIHPTLIGAFETFEACRTAAEADLNRRGLRDGSYDCGRKCERRRQGHYSCAENRLSPRPAERP